MSWGGGVQSTAIALLCANQDERLLSVTNGQLPEAFVFADTGDERLATYEHIWKMADLMASAGLKLYIVRKDWRTLAEQVAQETTGIDLPPVFVEDKNQIAVPVNRGCTKRWKVQPLDRWARERFKHGRPPKGEKWELRCVQWYGMSTDELQRLRESNESWRRFSYPLVDMGWARHDCANYIESLTYLDGSPIQAIRSSCVYCPYHSKGEWREVAKVPEDWAKAVALDEALRAGDKPIAGLETHAYVLRNRTPLRDYNPLAQTDLFEWDGGLDNDCDGVCGV